MFCYGNKKAAAISFCLTFQTAFRSVLNSWHPIQGNSTAPGHSLPPIKVAQFCWNASSVSFLISSSSPHENLFAVLVHCQSAFDMASRNAAFSKLVQNVLYVLRGNVHVNEAMKFRRRDALVATDFYEILYIKIYINFSHIYLHIKLQYTKHITCIMAIK